MHILSRFWVDSIPIRVFKKNGEAAGIPYPSTRPMRIFSTLWNGDNWATDGGRVKVDWGKAPFVATYQSFDTSKPYKESNKHWINQGSWVGQGASPFTQIFPISKATISMTK